MSYTRVYPPIHPCPEGISIGSAVFEQMTTKCPYTLEWDPFPLIIPLLKGEC